MEWNGVINIYKEAGFTSHDVVAKLRGILHQKKIGHTGTLDPDAEGVLPVCLGKATRLCDMLTDHEKEYEAVLRLGVSTDTQDSSGAVLCEKPVLVSEQEIRTCILSFVGEQMQIPPMYSALKVNGKKLYELARAGIEVERKARPVTFYEIEVLAMELPLVRIRVRCSRGTYIRTLCHDIGEKLGCGGCMEKLLRTGVGRFRIGDALKLAEVEQRMAEGTLQDVVVKIDQMFSDYESRHTMCEADRPVHNGNSVLCGHLQEQEPLTEGQYIRIYDSEDHFIGIYRKNGDSVTPVKMFLLT